MTNLVLGIVLAVGILTSVAYKWELNFRIVFVSALIIGLFAGLLINSLALFFNMGLLPRLISCVFLIVVTALAGGLVRFYRDPNRVPPQGENIILSPADGRIKYIKDIEKNEIPFSSKGREKIKLSQPLIDILENGEGYLIGIAMTYLDVHITRAAINGKLSYFEHVPGRFLSLKRDEAPYRNERLIEIIDNGKCKIGLIQIASRLVRRILSYVREGDELDLGQKIGMITFGSQVDVVLPRLRGLEIRVSVGQQVYAGTSMIAQIQST